MCGLLKPQTSLLEGSATSPPVSSHCVVGLQLTVREVDRC